LSPAQKRSLKAVTLPSFCPFTLSVSRTIEWRLHAYRFPLCPITCPTEHSLSRFQGPWPHVQPVHFQDMHLTPAITFMMWLSLSPHILFPPFAWFRRVTGSIWPPLHPPCGFQPDSVHFHRRPLWHPRYCTLFRFVSFEHNSQ